MHAEAGRTDACRSEGLRNLVNCTPERSRRPRFFAGAQNDTAPRTAIAMDMVTATAMVTGARDSLETARERFTARVSASIPGVQDGGVVSALLIELLESGEIDGALVAKPSEREPWKGVAHLAQTREDVIACAGSFYNQTLALGHLDLKKYDLPAETAHRPRRHPLRDPGLAGDAAAAVLLGGVQGRRRRPDRRPALHQELRLRGADAAGDPGASAAFRSRTSTRSTSSAASSTSTTRMGPRSSKNRSATSTARPSKGATSARISWGSPPISPSAASAARTATPAS